MIQPTFPVLAPQRRELIRSLVRDEGIVRVEDLRQNLKVSVATIRRDLEILEENGRLQRVHGGAVTMENRLEEAVFDDKTNQASKEKSRIADEACKLISTGDSVYLDGGSTTLGLARLLMLAFTEHGARRGEKHRATRHRKAKTPLNMH